MNEKELNVVVKLVAGSHLYGTASETSDRDFKGIYLPTLKDVVNKNDKDVINFNTNNSGDKNSSDDVDVEYYSLHKFLQLCKKGETVAMDMLHSPEYAVVFKTPLWDVIRGNRCMFYTTKISAFLGYCKSQAVKYGEKGNRLTAIEEVLKVLEHMVTRQEAPNQFDFTSALMVLPRNKHCYSEMGDDGAVWYHVLDKKFRDTNKMDYVLNQVQKIYRGYGERTKKAQENKGVDWKAISHAFRYGYQLEELFSNGDIQFPLRQKLFIKSVKYGNFDYVKDGIAKQLDDLIERVETLVNDNERKFPESVSFDYWDNFEYQIMVGK